MKIRQVWNLMPLDPVAWLVLWNEHQRAFGKLIRENLHSRLSLEAISEPRKAQVHIS